MRRMRRFNDPVGLGFHSYWELLALALFAWHEKRSLIWDARRILGMVVFGHEWFRKRFVRSVISSLDSWHYIHFECQSFIWRPEGWRECPSKWRLTDWGREKLQELLANIGLSLDTVLKQPNQFEVKGLIDNRIRSIYRELWERIRRYEAAVSNAELSEAQTQA
jgi:hypothetical protein